MARINHATLSRGQWIRTLAFAGTVLLYLAISLANTSFHASAQSGRVAPTPTPTPTPTPETKFVVDRSGDQYLLAFPTSFDGIFRKGKLYYRGTEYERAQPSMLNSFIEHVNLAGARGYRVVASAGFFPFAILKLDEVQYEYGWFVSRYGRFDWAFSPQEKKGLRLVDHFLVDLECDENSACDESFMSLVERVKGAEQPREHFLVTRGRKESDSEMLQQIKQKISEGFYPAWLIDGASIFFEKSAAKDQLWNDREVKIVRWGWLQLLHDDTQKKINELAKDGYRLALIGHGFALMYRSRLPAPPVTYIWVDSRKKTFAQTLAQLQAGGARFVTTYPNNWEQQSNLIFEKKVIDDGKRYEYRVLTFETNDEPDPTLPNKVRSTLTDDSTAALQTLNSLATDGFIVRDFFSADKFSLLLERTK